MRFETAMQVERFMFLVWKTLFGASPLVLRDLPRQDAKTPTQTHHDPEPPSDAIAEKLWKEWLDDDDWRVGKP